MASFYAQRDNVRALHRVRVVVATRDRRFLRASAFLLTRSGLEVYATHRLDDVPVLVARHEPHVVVFDTSDSLAAGVRMLAAVEALYPHVSMLFVCDDPPARSTSSLRVLPKWPSVERLVDEVERTYVHAQGRNGSGAGF
jgi:DNA-binding NtrC family response regulator